VRVRILAEVASDLLFLSIKHLRSEGVTLVIDVARVADGRQTFRRMTELARHSMTEVRVSDEGPAFA